MNEMIQVKEYKRQRHEIIDNLICVNILGISNDPASKIINNAHLKHSCVTRIRPNYNVRSQQLQNLIINCIKRFQNWQLSVLYYDPMTRMHTTMFSALTLCQNPMVITERVGFVTLTGSRQCLLSDRKII